MLSRRTAIALVSAVALGFSYLLLLVSPAAADPLCEINLRGQQICNLTGDNSGSPGGTAPASPTSGRPGDQITIISTGAPAVAPGAATQPAQSTPRQIDAVLVDLKASPSTGTTTLIVEVDAADATTLAAYAAGTVSVILDGPK